MKDKIVLAVLNGMSETLDADQMTLLERALKDALAEYNVAEKTTDEEQRSKENADMVAVFVSAKKIEGCSEKTLSYYQSSIEKLLEATQKSVKEITTNDIRCYLADKQEQRALSKVTIDNLLISTGMRVGELVKMNREDIDFHERQCVVFGKGNKEREVYFNARTKIHLKRYLEERTDTSPALFVSLHAPYTRLTISGVESRLRRLGKAANIGKVHPHKFRRTLATMAIDKGMPIEQVQKLLGHVKIDTTLHYAMVNQTNVKMAHRKFIN